MSATRIVITTIIGTLVFQILVFAAIMKWAEPFLEWMNARDKKEESHIPTCPKCGSKAWMLDSVNRICANSGCNWGESRNL